MDIRQSRKFGVKADEIDLRLDAYEHPSGTEIDFAKCPFCGKLATYATVNRGVWTPSPIFPCEHLAFYRLDVADIIGDEPWLEFWEEWGIKYVMRVYLLVDVDVPVKHVAVWVHDPKQLEEVNVIEEAVINYESDLLLEEILKRMEDWMK